jgi:dolichyl-phosphate-mannose-protein mannosyltransferase
MAKSEAQAPGLSAKEPELIDFSIRVKGIWLLLGVGLGLRLALAALPGFGVDIALFRFWADRLAADGPWNFYEGDFFIDYAPGYLYVLWFIGQLNQAIGFSAGVYEYVLKLPAVAADIASAYLLYLILAPRRMEIRLGAVLLYLLFPATLLIGPIWGQVDSLLAFFLLLSVYYIGRDRPIAGALAYTVGFLVKPQAIAALPFLAFWIMRKHPPEWRKIGESLKAPFPPGLWFQITGAALLLVFVVIFPFFLFKPWDFIVHLYNSANVEHYRVNSFWAYNFWNTGGLFEMGFQPDSQRFLGITHQVWGIAMYAGSMLLMMFLMRKSQGTGMLALGAALSVLFFYMFLTRMHERYVFAFFLPFLAACALINSRWLWGALVILGAAHFLNLYHVYGYYEANDLRIQGVYRWLEESNLWGTGLETVQVLSIVMVVSVPLLLAAAYALSNRRPQPEPL